MRQGTLGFRISLLLGLHFCSGALAPHFVFFLFFFSSATAQLSSNFQQPTRNYSIRTDVHFDQVGKVLKAMLELPGVKKSDVKIVLSKCPHTRVKQITVAGISRSVFPDVEYTIRERKFGRFLRVLIVPPETTVCSHRFSYNVSD
jgi:HSP20 family molecular chaperone IbpA